MQLSCVNFLIYSFTCPSSKGKQTLTGRAACLNCSYIVVKLPCPFQMTDCQRSHWQRMIEMHFSPSLLLLHVFVYHLFGLHVEKKAVKMQQRKVSIFCWLIMESTHLTLLKQPLHPMWSLFFRLWLFSCAITKSASQWIHNFVLILKCPGSTEINRSCWIIMVIHRALYIMTIFYHRNLHF